MVNIENLIPCISIKADVSPYEFLVRMGDIAEDNGDIDVRKNYLDDKSFPSLSLLFITTKPDDLEDLYGMFTIRSRDEERVWVELISKSWAVSNPTYEEYVKLVRSFIGPLLSLYNKKYSTNRRFRIPAKDKLEHKLSKYPARLFQHFVDYANKSFLSRISWRHFYSFILCCHQQNEYLCQEEFEYLLKEAGFNDYYCDKLCSIFEHGWDLLDQLPESKSRALRKKMREQIKQEQESQSSNRYLDK